MIQRRKGLPWPRRPKYYLNVEEIPMKWRGRHRWRVLPELAGIPYETFNNWVYGVRVYGIIQRGAYRENAEKLSDFLQMPFDKLWRTELYERDAEYNSSED